MKNRGDELPIVWNRSRSSYNSDFFIWRRAS